MKLTLESLRRCFDGVLPSVIATVSKDGVPNVTYLSSVHYVDDRHIALSRQFFNKTTRNILENPYAVVKLRDGLTAHPYTLGVKFVRSETAGPLFDRISMRVQAIASHTGMKGIFKLLAADVFEVESVDAFATDVGDALDGLSEEDAWGPTRSDALEQRSEIWVLQRVSGRVSQARSVDQLLEVLLQTLQEELGFNYARVLLCGGVERPLVVRASRGFGEAAIGRKVSRTDGLIGAVAQERRPLRLSRVEEELRYGRTVRKMTQREDLSAELAPELPLPGLAEAQSHLVIPLVDQGQLLGVIAVEDPAPAAFEAWHEAFLEIVANQVASALARLLEDEDSGDCPTPTDELLPAPHHPRKVRRFQLYKSDDCVFLDGEYLVRGVPARILWKLLNERLKEGRREFSNRELRLDPQLGLPDFKDNLESRLSLLKNRLVQKCDEAKVLPAGRGRFTFDVTCEVELVERQ